MLLRPYECDSRVQKPYCEAILNGFLHHNYEGTESLYSENELLEIAIFAIMIVSRLRLDTILYKG